MIETKTFTIHRQPTLVSQLVSVAVVGLLLAMASLLAAIFFAQVTMGLYALFALTLAHSALLFWLHRQRLSASRQVDQPQARWLEQLREGAAQAERNRLARDLHDTIKQQLFSINVVAATAQSLLRQDVDAALTALQEVRSLTQAALSEMKALLTQLRPHPLDNIGLIEAIREQLDALHFRAEVATALHCDDLPASERLGLGAQESLFRAVQESLSNIARHARAQTVTVHLTHDEKQLILTIVDDGQGFDPTHSQTGMGLLNVRTRLHELGGTALITAAPGQGCQVRLTLPLLRPQAQIDPALIERRYTLAWQISTAGTAIGAALLYLFAAAPTPIFTPIALLVLSAGVVLLWQRWQMLRPIIPASYLPWMRWVDIVATISFGASFLGLAGIINQASWQGCAAACAGLLFSLGAILFRSYAMRDSVHEWTTIEKEQSQRHSLQWVLPLFGLMQLFWFLDNGYAPALAEWRTRYLTENRFWFVWLLLMLLPLITSTLNIRWLRARQAAVGNWRPAAVPVTLPAPSAAVRRMRTSATALTWLLFLVLLPLAGSVLIQQQRNVIGLVGVSLMLALLLLGGKWWVEQWLSQRLAAWTTLALQQQAEKYYRHFFVYALLMCAGGIVGFLYARFEPVDNHAPAATLATQLLAGALAACISGAPPYLGLMVYISHQRVKWLTAHAAPETVKSKVNTYPTLTLPETEEGADRSAPRVPPGRGGGWEGGTEVVKSKDQNGE